MLVLVILRRLHWSLFALLWGCFIYAHQGDKSPIARSRLDALQARWNHGSWVIDAYHKNTPDKALVNGHYYSDKAPGTLLLAAPGFLLSAVSLSLAGAKVDSPAGWLVTSWSACAFGVALVAALGGVACFSWLTRYVSLRAAWVTTVAIFLGAAPWPYSTMLFSHGAVVGLVCLALWALDREDDLSPESVGQSFFNRPLVREATAGLGLGLALASEYSAGLVIVGLLLFFGTRDWRRMMRVGLWMIPPLLLIPAYSWACYDNPFTIGYAHNANFPHLKRGFFGLGWPDMETAWRLLFSPARGLCFWTPFLLLALPGYALLVRRDLRLFWAAYLIPVIQVAALSGNDLEWMGGPCLGPRYLAGMLPLMALPAALIAERWPRLALALALLSIALTGTATLVHASLPLANLQPLTEVIWPQLCEGKVAFNLGQALGASALWSTLLPLALLLGLMVWADRRLKHAGEINPCTSPAADAENPQAV